MTMQAEFVTTGAAATRRASPENPMEVLTRLRADDPTENFTRQFQKWRKIVERREGYLEAALLQAFRCYWSALDRDARKGSSLPVGPGTPQPQPQPQPQPASQAAAAQLAEKIRRVVLLDLEMPNGKKLRDCTFGECSKFGAWFAKVGKQGKPQQIVGQVLSEDQLHRIK